MDLKEHWKDVKPEWRHIINKMPKEKQERIINNFKEYFIKPLDLSKIKSSMDWGCGGGLLTKELKQFTNPVHALDISQDSLNNCIKFAYPEHVHLVNDIDKFQWKDGNVDLIICHALVWHFPSLEYFGKVLNVWKSMSPEYIAFNTKPLKNKPFEETSSYEDNYLHALKLSEIIVEDMLLKRGYVINSKNHITTGATPQIYYTFKKQ